MYNTPTPMMSIYFSDVMMHNHIHVIATAANLVIMIMLMYMFHAYIINYLIICLVTMKMINVLMEAICLEFMLKYYR